MESRNWIRVKEVLAILPTVRGVFLKFKQGEWVAHTHSFSQDGCALNLHAFKATFRQLQNPKVTEMGPPEPTFLDAWKVAIQERAKMEAWEKAAASGWSEPRIACIGLSMAHSGIGSASVRADPAGIGSASARADPAGIGSASARADPVGIGSASARAEGPETSDPQYNRHAAPNQRKRKAKQ
uniref:Uncharacterized protein n=1 Tax=Chromera velia CCMP2878 TaxID=1169474 RepID=A0A0G4IDT3_9ALVE|eukprot:Cvel_13379.t1-p1 / transcript=Cvel_13379.t1 / gene=Cvel_13379 / organism=Chromera_velia_CCMP2878 / gene_product=Glutelin-2, putative / transcript_product=Glutelin-2, putative / location=Cvel_scaffold910:47269-49960(+) / protein_length=182 / sequence_SO=supercontig / SO=protein_coding / is_pseudo=false